MGVANWLRDAATGRAKGPVQWILCAAVPPLLAFAIESLLLGTVTRWLLFNGAVIVSSWLGGPAVGLASTVLSAALVWWGLMPPERALQITDPRYYLTVVIFLAIGIAVSMLHESLRRARRGLASAAGELEEAQRLAHIGSWTWDFRSNTGWWSPELYRIHRRDPALPIPGPADLSTFFTPESNLALREAAERLNKEGAPFELELESISPDGVHTWVSTHGEGVRDASGRLVGLRGTSQDITRLKELERMKEEWTSVIAHDLRQPIGVITMSLEMLPQVHPRDLNKPESASVYHIRSAANSLNRMVNDLLDVSRIEAHRLSLERKWMDPQRLVEDTLDHLKHLTEHCRVDVNAEGGVSPVYVDPGRFEQILGNLVSNAVKYGERRSGIDVRLTQSGHEVLFAVENRGPGISSEDLSRLFTRFGRPATQGTGVSGIGLGLYIARGLVEAHGGRMWGESKPGETTTFYFSLPSRDAAAAAA